ncbi:MAG: type I-E CRISPR-associated protein Cas5/CasD [Anaerolineae bacterium]|nr:type I-E CRISPR-associated protein Cas5/CasD [Anaerolineae bacterium]
MANTLFLRLEGPLQAWGERGRWSVRDTASEPTKSGVIGLVACALGYHTDAQIRPLAEKTRMAVRCDAPGQLITDYHTVGGGYDYPTLLTAQGKPKLSSGSPHTELTWRDYLCDASFLVALQSQDEVLIEQMAQALQHPVWPVYLGRKSCPPSRPVFDGVGHFDDLEEALQWGSWSLTVKPPKSPVVRCVLETLDIDGVRRRDQILSRQYRQFGPRYTKDKNDIPIVIEVEAS